MMSPALLARRALPFALAIGIWLVPVPAGLTAPAWHLFAIFVAAIAAVLLGAFPLLTSTMLAVAAVVLSGTISPAKAFGGLRQCQRAAGGHRVPRRAGGREVGIG